MYMIRSGIGLSWLGRRWILTCRLPTQAWRRSGVPCGTRYGLRLYPALNAPGYFQTPAPGRIGSIFDAD